MKSLTILTTLAAAVMAADSTNDDPLVGLFVFTRHGDRTTKVTPKDKPYYLTELGKTQCFESGQYYRDRYINNSSDNYLQGMNDEYMFNQISATAPNSQVLMNSATAFLQGLYPPSKSSQVQTLSNGSSITAPLDGYQYVTLNGQDTLSPNNIWIKGDENCPAFTKASTSYYDSSEFKKVSDDTKDFYKSVKDLLDGALPDDKINYKNAYSVFDYVNVNSIHNETYAKRVDSDTLNKLRYLADQHEFAINYNPSNPDSCIGGKTLLAGMRDSLQSAMNGKPKMTFYSGSYNTFLQFFGLTDLTAASPDFYGLPVYASTIAMELRKSSSGDATVRFLLRNGTDSDAELKAFPLFGQEKVDLPWNDFNSKVDSLALKDPQAWCGACGSDLDFCNNQQVSTSEDDEGGLSNVAAGFIGFGVTAAVAILAIGGFILLSRKNSAKAVANPRMQQFENTMAERV